MAGVVLGHYNLYNLSDASRLVTTHVTRILVPDFSLPDLTSLTSRRLPHLTYLTDLTSLTLLTSPHLPDPTPDPTWQVTTHVTRTLAYLSETAVFAYLGLSACDPRAYEDADWGFTATVILGCVRLQPSPSTARFIASSMVFSSAALGGLLPPPPPPPPHEHFP